MRFNANETLLISANGSSQNVALPAGSGLKLSIANAGAQNAFVALGTSANMTTSVPTASAGGGLCVLANQSVSLEMPVGTTRIAAISSGNSSLFVSRGDVL